MRRSGRVAAPGAERTHQRGGVQILRGGQGPDDAAVGPDQLRADVHPVRAGSDGVDPSGPRGRGVADLRAVGETQQRHTLTQQVPFDPDRFYADRVSVQLTRPVERSDY